MYKTLPIKLNLTNEEKVYWTEQCQHSNSLFNCGLYEVKNHYYKQLESERRYSTYWREDDFRVSWQLKKALGVNYNVLDKLLKSNKHYRGLPAQAAQQTLKIVASSIDSFNRLVDAFFAGTVDKPKLPRYRKSSGLFAVSFPTTNLKFANGAVRLPVTSSAKPDMICDTWIDIPEFVIVEQIKVIRIRPSRGEFWCDFVIDDGKPELEVNPNLKYNQALAIDHGVKFWLSAVTTKGKSFIVEAPQLKTAIWKYQQKVKQYKKGKSGFYWDEYLDKLTAKYNLQVRDSVNKAARFVINHCLKNGIGNLVIGWNQGNKQNINLGRKNNYEVVSMPTARLIKRLEELSKEYGIKFIVTTEEYTSKASFVDDDVLHRYGEKPKEWKPSGKRISRDEYRTKDGRIIHADLNAAGNILRKVFDQVFSYRLRGKIQLELIKRDALTHPKRYSIFQNLKKKYRKQTSRRMASASVATSA
ncbi:MAG: transposase [Rivularia sp. (in: cyanobacteria)]